ncbi:hypothetical protein [Clostridium estertheticum]|uniref:Uncharacterized protein n=1 Tax=Clostridium estertheticum subsp. estertheticum TaxID=1552 RepID=A0A1J0GKP1_9CLOT|nr:hypothetical protein [Clostridium estertheticum]APC41520.1 hypothetical protein A7L45_16265 [Clostridium estertheticum subsp. estertheticum]
MINIPDLVAKIRAAVLGVEVKLTIADGIEAINTVVEDTTARQLVVEDKQTAVEVRQDLADSNEIIRKTNEIGRINVEGERVTEFNGIKTEYDSYKNVMIAESNVAALQNGINKNTSDLANNTSQLDSLNTNKADKTALVTSNLNITNNTNAIKLKANQESLDITNATVTTKTDKAYVDTLVQAIASGAPSTIYTTLALLKAGIPAGNTKSYLTTDGNWNYWNGSAWVAGGVYQGTNWQEGINARTDFRGKVSATLKDSIIGNEAMFYNSLKFELSDNLYNGVRNESISATGAIENIGITDIYSTDYIKVLPNSQVYTNAKTLSGINPYSLCVFDINKTFIGAITVDDNGLCFLPYNAVYIRTNVKNGSLQIYDNGALFIKNYIPKKLIESLKASTEIETLLDLKNKNLYDGTISIGIRREFFGDIINTSSDFAMCNFIEIVPNSVITHNLYNYYPAGEIVSCNFYDANSQYVCSMRSSTANFTTPSNAKYVVFNLKVLAVNYDATGGFELYCNNIDESGIINDVQNSKIDIANLKQIIGLENGKEIIHVSDFYDGIKTDSQVIIDCLNFCSLFGKRTIIFDQKDWNIDEVILLESDTTIIVDGCTIKQKDNVFDNVFRGNNLTIDPSNPYGAALSVADIKNIKILGINNAKIIGCNINKTGVNPIKQINELMIGDVWGWRTLQISLSKCDGFEISGFAFTQQRCWAIGLDKCSNGSVHDLNIVSTRINGDGVDLRAGCHNIDIYNITGQTWDDGVACSALSLGNYPVGGWAYPMEPTNGLNASMNIRDLDIHDITISNITLGGVVASTHDVILLCANGLRVYNIQVNDIIETNVGVREAVIYIITGYGGGYVDNDLNSIRVNNVVSKIATNAIMCNAKVNNMMFNKIKQEKVGGALSNITNMDGITITNS